MTTTEPKASGAVRAFLTRDHARIEGLHARLMDELRDERTGAAEEMWRRLHAAVRDHMAAEERYLLRRFAHTDRREAALLRAQHATLRRMLAEAAVSVRGHRDVLERFIAQFWEHARREDHLLYRWAEDEVDDSTAQKIARELSEKDRATASDRSG